MAGFNPHINVASNNYTALGQVQAQNFLDSLVNDVTGSSGGAINGWSLYDDMRVTGSSYPVAVRLYTSQGSLSQYYASSYSWQFTNNSNSITGYTVFGYDFRYNISPSSSSLTPISVDLVNWYNAYYSGTNASSYSVATLDRNFSQATTSVRDIYTRVSRYVVFQCQSSQKTFYLFVGQRSDVSGGHVVYMRVFESWNLATHAGTNGSAMEHIKFWQQGAYQPTNYVQYISWFLPDTFALYTRGGGNYGLASWENFSFVGNMDTSSVRSTDKDALIYIPGDTSYSGYNVVGTLLWSDALYTAMEGAAQCLRTIDGMSMWSSPGFASNLSPRNAYSVFPRGRWYAWSPGLPEASTANHLDFCEIDAYEVGSWLTSSLSRIYTKGAGRRGMLRYLRVPMGNPTGMLFSTYGPANDGTIYIIVRQISAPRSALSTGQVASNLSTVGIIQNGNIMNTGWAFTNLYGTGEQSLGDIGFGGGTVNGGFISYFMMPVV